MSSKFLSAGRRLLRTMHNSVVMRLPAKQRLEYLHWRRLGEWPDLNNPRRFTEKLCWRKLYDRNPLFPVTADKVRVRDFVAERVGPQYLPRIYGVFDDPDEIDFPSLPPAFVLKANHGCGWNWLVRDKTLVDWNELRTLARSWLNRRYDQMGGEWWYGAIQPKLLIEEFVPDEDGKPARDYRFYVFSGGVAMVQVEIDKFSNWRRNSYDSMWQRLPFSLRYPQGADVPRPPHFEIMLAVASRLGADFDFVRVDLYDVADRMIFGELTLCPASGWMPFSDSSYNLWLGQLMKLPIGKAHHPSIHSKRETTVLT